MESAALSRAQPPLLEHFTAAPVAASSVTTTSTAGLASPSASLLPPPTQPANPQDDSLFFTRLPSEIRRMIYVEVWRTFGSDGYADGDDGHDHEEADHPHRGSTARGGLSPHITASMTPSKSWMTSPLVGSSSRSDGGTDDTQQQPRQAPPLSSPWTRQIRGFTSAPCFLAVDDDGDDASSKARQPPEADDVRPARLAAAHTADLDAAANSNGNSIWQGGVDQLTDAMENSVPAARQRQRPSSSTWRARWNSPWLAHWACEEYFSGAARTGEATAPSDSSAAAAAASSVRSEDHRRRRPPLRWPYLPILLTCRRAYVEGIDLLYSALTFQFTEMATAEGFLERWPCVASVRLVMHLSTSLLDFYRHADDDQGIITAGAATVPNGADNDAVDRGPGAVTIGTFPRLDNERDRGLLVDRPDANAGGTVVNARNNAWQRLCAGLSADRLPNLRRLQVWVEAHDLRGWHKAAAEKRLFAKLLEAGGGGGQGRRRLTADNFVLYLPMLPVDGKARGLPGCYLDEEATGDETSGMDGKKDGKDEDGGKDDRDRPGLPCTIVRTERPDYWDVHLNMRPVFVNRRMSIGSRVAALRRAGFL